MKTCTLSLVSLFALAALGCVATDGERGSASAGDASGIASIGDAGSAAGSDSGDEGTGSSGGGEGEAGSATSPGTAPKFDLGDDPSGPAGEGGTGCDTERCECTIPDHVPCDAASNDLFHAVGLNCAGELQVQDSTMGPAGAMGLRSSFGGTNTYAPREGAKYAVLGSGLVADLDSETPGGDSDAFPTHCNDDLGGNDPGAALPAPIKVNDVGGDCTQNAALLGTGDCSNTIQGQFSQGNEANDYVEMRFELDVPPDVISFSYDFAFFSVEYPDYYGSVFNDMYIGWLESELWTGNISFDANGNPISLNAGFLEFKDDGANLAEFDNTCMKQHAGTNWLTSTAGVTGGEHITVVLAIFDLSDSILDSYVFVDNFQWGCDPTGMPSTEPEG